MGAGWGADEFFRGELLEWRRVLGCWFWFVGMAALFVGDGFELLEWPRDWEWGTGLFNAEDAEFAEDMERGMGAGVILH